MAYNEVEKDDKNGCNFNYKFFFQMLNWINIQQLFKKDESQTPKTKILKVDDEKFDDNFRFYPTGQNYRDQMAQVKTNSGDGDRKKCVGALPPKTEIDLQSLIDVIKATDGCFDSERYLTSTLSSIDLSL